MYLEIDPIRILSPVDFWKGRYIYPAHAYRVAGYPPALAAVKKLHAAGFIQVTV